MRFLADIPVMEVYNLNMDKVDQSLIDEIQGLLPELDRESLVFLKEQVSVLHYNIEVRKKNSQINKKQKSKNVKKAKAKAKAHQPKVYIEQLRNEKFFNLYINDAQLFMDYHEIKSILKIAKAAETPEKGAVRLYNWFKNERKDVLVDGHIPSNNSSLLKLIYKELLDTFQ